MSDDERAIRELVDQWMVATMAGDLPTILDLISDDALFLTPGREPFGKEDFRAASEAMKGAKIDARASIQEIEVVGDWAWLRNQIDLTVTGAHANPIHRSGATLTIFHKGRDGSWRLYRDANFVG